MVTLVCLLVLSQPQVSNQVSAEEYIEQLVKKKDAAILQLEKQIEDLPKKNDWSKLSSDAKAKLEKPLREAIAAAKNSKELQFEVKDARDAKTKDVFKLPRTNRQFAINDEYIITKVIDDHSVKAQRLVPKDLKERITPGLRHKVIAKMATPEDLIIEGLKPGEFVEKEGALIKLSGLWCRIENLQFDGKSVQRIERWPHEAEAKKLWSKRIKEAEKAERDAAREKAAKEKADQAK